MNLNDFKPDFEKIIDTLEFPQSSSKYIYSDWDKIIKGDISYNIAENTKLISLLKEFNFESSRNDFIYLAFRSLRLNAGWHDLKSFKNKYSSKREELNNVLQFLISFDTAEIKIDFKHTRKNITTSIKNEILIQAIFESLAEYFIKNDYYIEQGFAEPEEIKDLSKYLNFVIEEQKLSDPVVIKHGRKKKHGRTAMIIDNLQKYLQRYTHLKAEEGISVSRRQSIFIYKFLIVLDIIPDNLSWQADNIRLILNKYRSNKAQVKPINMIKSIEEYEIYAKDMKSKIKNLFIDNRPSK